MKKAADALHRSHSVVSRAVDELEKALAVPLFERQARGARLTVYGDILRRRVEQAFAEMQAVRTALWQLAPASGVHYANAPIYTLSIAESRLNLFLLFAQYRHMSAVARHAGVSQPAVSMALRDLDLTIGQALFEPVSDGFRLTPAGEILIRHVKRALVQLRLAGAEIAYEQGSPRGRLLVGALPYGGATILAPAVAGLLRQHPRLRVNIQEGSFSHLADRLAAGDLDMVVGALQPTDAYPELLSEPLFDDPIVIVARAGHPLAGKRRATLADTARENWVLPIEGAPTRRALSAALAERGLAAPQVVVESSNPSTISSLLQESNWVSAGAQACFRRVCRPGYWSPCWEGSL
uniref:Putative LysR-type regulator n=1 Tax=Bordetella sp. 10d TaxID=170622 RepID=Q76CA8_9BORD|nr:putative LysR -type regulator [Bordetella sp. 10d]